MNKKKPQTKKVDFFTKGVPLFIFFSILFLTLAYSESSVNARIENIMASVKPTQDARITDLSVYSTSNNGLSSSEDYNAEKIYGTLELGNSNSTVTYKISVTVFLASEMKLTQITGLNPKLEYEITDYELGKPLCNSNNVCNYGAVKNFYLTIKYKPGEFDPNNTTYPYNLDFTFEEVEQVAKVGTNYFETLQEAVDFVPANNTETTVTLLKNTSEEVIVPANKNINFDLQNNILSNNGNPVPLTNHGTVKISNGIITVNNAQAAINNEAGANLYISGGKIISTGSKQALYNNGGTVEISGDAYLSTTSNQRGAVQNLASGIMVIKGGTIVATRYSAVVNAANLTIGTRDGSVHEFPDIQGSTNGINSTTAYSFYDGIIKGKNAAVNDETLISDIERGMSILHEDKAIDGVNYHSIRLADVVTVTFDPNGGTVDETTREMERGAEIGILPSPTRDDYEFEGWYTSTGLGKKIGPTGKINNDIILYAHWIPISELTTAQIGDRTFNTLQQAVASVATNNTPVTITLLRNTSEAITINSRQNIVLDLQDYTISNKGVNPVIDNKGTLTISNGTLTSNTSKGVVDNEQSGTIRISGGRFIATGIRQALYNNGGTAYISGSAYFKSSTAERATINNLNNGKMTITGGTIISTGLNGIDNVATLTIGDKDGSINARSPLIQGVKYGINNTSTLNFYDGIIKGKEETIFGSITDQEDNSTRINGTEVIDGETYMTTYLQ